MPPQPLPINPFNPNTEAPLHDAFDQCMQMEANGGNDGKSQILARCLGYLIMELPHEARECVALEVVGCFADFGKMAELAQLYIDHLIRLFRQNKGHTPAPSEHPSRPSFELHSAFFSEAVEPAPRDHQTAKRSALRRDNYRCVVTGWADVASYYSMDAAALQTYNLHQNPPPLSAKTNFCHIFPPSTNWNFGNPNDPVDKKKKYAGIVWAIINSFRSIDVLRQLDGANIHSLENGFTMEVGLHGLFDDLQLWFEHIANDTYRLNTLHPRLGSLSHLPANPLITFTSTDPSLPLPNREYLKLHAAVCRVAHMSGAAGYLDQEDRDVDRIGVLARDGSSADLLASRLRYVTLKA